MLKKVSTVTITCCDEVVWLQNPYNIIFTIENNVKLIIFKGCDDINVKVFNCLITIYGNNKNCIQFNFYFNTKMFRL